MAPIAYPVTLPEEEKDQVRELYRSLLSPGIAELVDSDEVRHPIPESVYRVLIDVLAKMQEGKAVAVVPLMLALTTKKAADILGVSRQYFVRLLDQGQIAFHRAGTHRRIYLRDLIEYRNRRDRDRHASIERIARQEMEDGTYDKFVEPEE
jgi:excisionase family DNA binding protein